MLRVQDVIDKYNPDLLYFDDNCDWDFDAGAPAGRELNVWLGMPELARRTSWRTTTTPTSAGTRANWMRCSISRMFPAAVLSTLVRDFEMSQADAIEPNPWQTDACIGGWHYSRSIFENHRYRTAAGHGSSSGRCGQQKR